MDFTFVALEGSKRNSDFADHLVCVVLLCAFHRVNLFTFAMKKTKHATSSVLTDADHNLLTLAHPLEASVSLNRELHGVNTRASMGLNHYLVCVIEFKT